MAATRSKPSKRTPDYNRRPRSTQNLKTELRRIADEQAARAYSEALTDHRIFQSFGQDLHGERS